MNQKKCREEIQINLKSQNKNEYDIYFIVDNTGSMKKV